jgi:hypothetical protein
VAGLFSAIAAVNVEASSVWYIHITESELHAATADKYLGSIGEYAQH